MSEEPNRRASSDSGGCLTSKSCGEVYALDSGSPAPAIPSDANTSDAVCEDKQKESSDYLKWSPFPAEDSNVSDEKLRLSEPPAVDDSSSPVKAVVEEACKIEDSRTLTCSEKASEDAPHSKTVSNGCVELLPPSVSEVPAEVNSGASNADGRESVVPSKADLDSVAFDVKADCVDPGIVQDAPDCAETGKPDRDAKTDGVDPGVVQDAPNRAGTDKPDGDAKTDGVDLGVVQGIPGRIETDKPDGESKTSPQDAAAKKNHVDDRAVGYVADRI